MSGTADVPGPEVRCPVCLAARARAVERVVEVASEGRRLGWSIRAKVFVHAHPALDGPECSLALAAIIPPALPPTARVVTR